MDGKLLQRMQRRSFERWRMYGKRKLIQRRATHKAVYSYNVRLEQRVINSLLKNCIEAKESRSFYAKLPIQPKENTTTVEALANLCSKRVLKKAFRAWLDLSINRRRIKDLNARICDLRDQLYLNKYIEAWKINCLEKKENMELDKKANEFYRNLLQQKTLKLWMDGHSENLLRMKKWNEATLHSRAKLLNKIWFAWIRYRNVKIEKANKIADARYFYRIQLLRKSLKKLASNVTKRIAERRMLEIATNRYEKILLRRVLGDWIENHRRALDTNLKIEMRCNRVENSSKEKILRQLRLYVWKKKCGRRRNYNSTNHYRRKVSKRAILMLKNYVLYRKQKATSLLRLNDTVTRISHEMQKVYIGRWRIAVVCRAQERQKIRKVEDHSSARSVKHHFSIWRVYSERYKIVAERKRTLRRVGANVLLNKYTARWMKKYAAAALINEKGNSAALIFRKNLMRRFFDRWREYIDKKNRERREIVEARNFHRKHVLRESLKKALKICLYKSELRYEKQLKTQKSRCIEDFEIMRKFFGKWWRAFAFAKENGKLKNANTTRKEKSVAYEIPYARSLPRRFVLPEYMTRSTSGFQDNCGFRERRYFSSQKLGLSSPSEISLSGSYDSSNLSSETYDTTDQDLFT